jgi:hypothetical protein
VNVAIQNLNSAWSGVLTAYFTISTSAIIISPTGGCGGCGGCGSDATISLADVANTLGISNSNVIWDPNSQKATVIKGKMVAQFAVGSNIMLLNGASVIMDIRLLFRMVLSICR